MQVEFLILIYRPKKLVDGAVIAVAYRAPSHEGEIRYRMAADWAKTVPKKDRAFIEMTLEQLRSDDPGLRFVTWEGLAESSESMLLMRERGMCEEEDVPGLLVPTPRSMFARAFPQR